MSKQTPDELETLLGQLLEAPLPGRPATNINDALQVADILEEKGFSFFLKDLRPKSFDETLWSAHFSLNEDSFTAENAEASVAICVAAAAALKKIKWGHDAGSNKR